MRAARFVSRNSSAALLLLLLPAGALDVHAGTWYVNGGASPGGDGSSWALAYQDIQEVLDDADFHPESGDVIWVAAGTYKPSARLGGPEIRYATYNLPAFIAMYGGFAGYESNLYERDPQRNETILSGDVGKPDDPSDNCYHVVSVLSDSYPQTVSGFTITRGNANHPSGLLETLGAGMRVGRPLPNHRAPIDITQCRFENNYASTSGAGLWVHPTFVNVVNCTFAGNTGGTKAGALDIAADASEYTCDLTNCVFYDNHGAQGGAAYIASPISSTFTNCTFCSNRATQSGGAIFLAVNHPPSTVAFRNCILWQNDPDQIDDISRTGTRTIDYTNIEDGWSGNGANNYDFDPLFCNAGSGNLRLRDGSPCIDAGNGEFVPLDVADVDDDGNDSELLPWDRAGFTRQHDAHAGADFVDLGAFENPHNQDCTSDLDGSGAVDLADLSLLLSCFSAAAKSSCTAGDFDCSGVVDLADLALLLSAFGSCE